MRTTRYAVAAAACAVALTGCGSADTPTDAGGTPATHSSAPHHAPSSPATTSAAQTVPASPSAPDTDAAGTPECTNGDVAVRYRHQDDATSHSYGFIVLTNTSGASCWVRGYGGISYAGDDGDQIGAPADRTPATPATVTLAPGATAQSELTETSYGPYSAKRCQRATAVALRVYIPDETDSQLVRHRLTVCANPKLHLMEHKPYVAG